VTGQLGTERTSARGQTSGRGRTSGRVRTSRRGRTAALAGLAALCLGAAPVDGLADTAAPAADARAGGTLAPALPAVLPPVDAALVDCEGPAPGAERGSPEWHARDLHNVACSQQRHLDQAAHPTTVLPADGPPYDDYRQPERHDRVRFRYDETTIEGLDVEVYRPCAAGTCPDLPERLETYEPPYPAVVTFHGGASRKELHWWSSQSLAEAGYLVIAYDSEGLGPVESEAETLVDWLDVGEGLAADFDGERLGVAGHSGGGVVVSSFGQRDSRVDAIVSWDRAQSTALPEDLPLDTPALYMFADYNCQQVPVCLPEPHREPPGPDGPGNKGEDFLRTRAAGVDTAQIALRASTHLDWVPSMLAASRYGELVSVYYTRAWFDRYVRGLDDRALAADAFERLTADVFDDSADRHNISQGRYDPARAAAAGDAHAGNVPYRLEGMDVADRLSFVYDSKCALTAPPGHRGPRRAASDDLRAEGCSTAAVGDAGPTGRAG
jgi:hypothetical protein